MSNTTESIDADAEIERLMQSAKPVEGTVGWFACIPKLQGYATTGYNQTPDAALVELRVNIRKNLTVILAQEAKLSK